MAENVVAFLITKINDILSSKLDLILSVDDKVRSLKNKFEWLQSFLKDVDARRRDSEKMKVWVSQIRDVAFEAEDALDRYLYEVQFQRQVGFTGSFKNCASYTRRLKTRQQLAIDIEGINQRLQEISASKSEFGIELRQPEGESSSSYYGPFHRPDKAMPIVEETNVVGFEKDIDILKQELLNGDPRRAAISIVGMGGLGKTTLARRLYNSDDVKRHFHYQSWIYVSQKYSSRELLQMIIQDFACLPMEKEMAEMTLHDLASKLAEYLRTRRYLLVIDDIWNVEAWDDIRNAVPEGNNGSRIIVTTRRKEVARYVDAQGFIHEPRCLSKEEGWDLFCLKVFGRKGGCPPELIEVGKNMVLECAGLPLGIIVLGGLLLRKPNSDREWRKVLERIRHELHKSEGTGGEKIQRILALSYDDLPHYLRSCFLYFGLYPEDSEIDVEELIQLWIAEGFIQARGQQTLEEVAEDYVEELVNRCMIQVVKRNSWGCVSRCRIHDLLHDLSISQGMDDKFLGILSPGNEYMPAPRRLAIHGKSVSGDCILPAITHPSSPSLLRSLLCFYEDSPSGIPQLCRFVSNLKLLTVLHVKVLDGDLLIKRLPKQIGGLVHLRYLGLDVPFDVLDLPSSIDQLRNLQTLRVEGCQACFVPDALWKIEALRHVICGSNLVMKGRGTHHLNCKRNLQTLLGIHAGGWLGRSLGEFTNLRALRIWLILPTHVPELSRSLERLTRLNMLHLEYAVGPSTGALRTLLAHLVNHPVLYELVIHTSGSGDPNDLPSCVELALTLLYGCIWLPQLMCSEAPYLAVQAYRSYGHGERQLPQEGGPLRFPPSLTRLEVGFAGLFSDQLASLESLPNLVILKLSNDAYAGKVMVFSPRGFRKLQELELGSLSDLEEWTIGDGAMPCLKKLRIAGCSKLKRLPEGLRHITTLQKLELRNMPKEFNRRVRVEDDEEDWDKVRRIPSVTIFNNGNVRTY